MSPFPLEVIVRVSIFFQKHRNETQNRMVGTSGVWREWRGVRAWQLLEIVLISSCLLCIDHL
jgi:hypothetical protein